MRVSGIQHVPAGGPDVLQPVYHPTLVVGPLENVAMLHAGISLHSLGLLLQLVPRSGGSAYAALFEEILAVEEHPGVREPWHPVYRALVGIGLHGVREVPLARFPVEEFGEVGDPTLRREGGRPGDVAADDVDPLAAGLKLGAELLVVLTGVRRHLPVAHLYLSRV